MGIVALVLPQAEGRPAYAYKTYGSKWADVDLPIMLNLDEVTSGPGTITVQQVKVAAFAAAQTWSREAGSALQFAQGRGANRAEEVSIEVTDSSDIQGYGGLACFRLVTNLDVCNSTSMPPPLLTGASVRINKNQAFSINGGRLDFDLQSLVLHELGHTIGLDHSEQREAVMWTGGFWNWLLGRGQKRSLAQDDINAVVALYGKRSLLPPSKPTLQSPADDTTISASMPLLDWNDAEKADSYYVQVSKSPAFTSFFANAKVDGSSYARELPLGGTYYWRVKTHSDSYGNSVWSPTRKFTTSPPRIGPSDAAVFLSHVTYPLRTTVDPGNSLIKVWRLANTGKSTWGSGYKLVFRDGNRLGAPESVNVPIVRPGEEGDLSVPLQILTNTTSGTYVGNWQLQNAQGTYFGPVISYSLVVPVPPTGNVVDTELVSVNVPSPVTPGQTFRPEVTVRVKSGQLRQDRGDMLRFYNSGTNYSDFPHVAVQGIADSGQNYTFQFYSDHPFKAPESAGTYESRWRVWANGGWVGPEIIISFTVFQPRSNHPPNRPSLTSPGDWAVFVAQKPDLCARDNGDPDGDAITAYRFEIFQSAQNWDSGWVGSSCATPPFLGSWGYQWRAKVRDSQGAESDWSETRHFNIESSTITLTDFHLEPAGPSNSDTVVIRAETSGCAGMGINLRALVNTATDGSASGEWKMIGELGVPKFNDVDAPRWDTLEYAEGVHLVRMEATSCDGTKVVRDIAYTLTRGRPSRPHLLAPAHTFWSNNRTVTFRWQDSMRSNGYTLIVGTSIDPELAPVLTTPVTGTEHTVTFDRDYPRLYWRVYSNNEFGRTEQGDRWLGIDLQAPSSALSGTATDISYDDQFALDWSASDDASGVASFDIQVRVDPDAQWNDWVTSYPYRSAIFSGRPGHQYCFRSRARDIAGNVEAYPSAPDRCVRIDPAKRPAQAWWNSNYAFKRSLVVVNRMGTAALPVEHPVQLHFDASTTPTAQQIYDASLASPRGDDIRVVYNDQTELARHIARFSPSAIDLTFASQADIPPAGSSSVYSLYYGNANPGTPMTDLNSVYQPRADAQTAALWHFEESSGDTPDLSGRNNAIAWTSRPARGVDYGRHGSGVHLDGTQWGTASASPTIGDNLTVETWVWFDTVSSSAWWMGIVAKFSEHDNRNRWRVTTYNDTSDVTKLRGDVYFIDPSGREIERNLYPSAALEANRWYHVALTYDGNELAFWLDGEKVTSLNQAGRVNDRGEPILIGRNHPRDPILKGRIDGLRISYQARPSFPYGAITAVPTVAAGMETGKERVGQTDLAVSKLRTFGNRDGGIVVEATVTNQGLYSTYNEFFVHLYADRTPTGPGDFSGSVKSWTNAALTAGAAITLTEIINPTPSASAVRNRDRAIINAEPAERQITLAAQVDSTGVVGETDEANNISVGQACVASADEFEDDGSMQKAKTIKPGETQSRNFDRVGDEDWARLDARKGTTYEIATAGLGASADTVVALYAGDGTTLLASNDDNGASSASRIIWQAPETGSYFVKIWNWNPATSGCGTFYSLSLSQQLPYKVTVSGLQKNVAR